MEPAPVVARDSQRGASLIEALIALLIVAVGMLGSGQWQMRLRQAVDLARQQSEAVRVAQAETEALRAFVTSAISPGLPSFAAIASGQSTSGETSGASTAYRVTRQVSASHATPSLKELVVAVDWADRSGVRHDLRVFSAIEGQAPVMILPLGQREAGKPVASLLGRHAAIPRDAHDLGDGRSIFKPVTAGDQAWLFDNRSGHIVARCNGIQVAKANRQLQASELTACTTADDLLLAGRLRVALMPPASGPDPASARDIPPALSVALELSGSGHPRMPACFGEAVRMVDVGSALGPRPIAVAIDATPAAQGLATWTELDDRFWRFHCAVSPTAGAAVNGNRTPAQWSGRLRFAPDGWTLGHATGSRRICRYSADTDGSGQVDRGAEAPDGYAGIADALLEQNFLLLGGEQACPAAVASTAAAGSLPWFDGNAATVPHQP